MEVEPAEGDTPAQTARNGWVDLRAENWAAWRERIRVILADLDGRTGPEGGSRWDAEPWQQARTIRPGALAAWIFRYEDKGERIKR